eukprot:COSAG02_NODE_2246_length_9389_cov_9.281270_4_plen_227_part_00
MAELAAAAEAELTLEPIASPSPVAAASRGLAGKMEAVCSAAMRGELDAVQAALKLAEVEPGYSVNTQGTSGRTALYQACLGRRPEIVKYLLELGAVRSSHPELPRSCMCPLCRDPTRRVAMQCCRPTMTVARTSPSVQPGEVTRAQRIQRSVPPRLCGNTTGGQPPLPGRSAGAVAGAMPEHPSCLWVVCQFWPDHCNHLSHNVLLPVVIAALAPGRQNEVGRSSS